MLLVLVLLLFLYLRCNCRCNDRCDYILAIFVVLSLRLSFPLFWCMTAFVMLPLLQYEVVSVIVLLLSTPLLLCTVVGVVAVIVFVSC